jgi:hypothetical protein
MEETICLKPNKVETTFQKAAKAKRVFIRHIKLNMEDAVYVCSWSRSPKGFTLWVKSRPKFRVSGATYEEAEERLIDVIQDSGGAMVPVMEFDPPLPKSSAAKKYATPEICLISGNEGFEADGPRVTAFETPTEREERFRYCDEFYEAPICRKCKNATSRRSKKPLTLRYAVGSYDGAFGRPVHNAGSDHEIVSENFLALLTAKERKSLDLRPVLGKGRKKFYEIVGPEGPPLVAIKGVKLSGWRCRKCSYRIWGHDSMDKDFFEFVAKSDLPKSVPSIFTIGVGPEIHLAATDKRWKELVGRKGTNGFTSRTVGVVPDNEVVRQPKLPLGKS